jgi:recombination protein U
MADISRQLIGLRNREAGELFERWIENACNYYMEKGVAYIEKTPEPMKPIKPYGERSRGQFIAYYAKTAQPDYKGILCDGTGIMFEAKHTDTDKMHQNVVSEDQRNSLDQYEKYGAHCYVMVSMRLEKFYRVPWDVWKQMKKLYGRKYMTITDLEPYKLVDKQCTILILEGVELKDED